jgi:hypothetical protein
MGRILRFVLFALALAALAVVLLAWAGYRAARYEPPFYRQALQSDPARQGELGDQMEQTVLDVHNQSRQIGRWEAEFTDEQLNGWLAVDLPAKFPELLPPQIRDPRIVIESQRARFACRVSSDAVSAVVSFTLELYLTDEPNTLAIRIGKVRAGALPVPLRQFLDPISTAASNSRIPLRWSQAGGDPVALLTIPSKHEELAEGEVHLDTIELREGSVYEAGSTAPDDPPPPESQH